MVATVEIRCGHLSSRVAYEGYYGSLVYSCAWCEANQHPGKPLPQTRTIPCQQCGSTAGSALRWITEHVGIRSVDGYLVQMCSVCYEQGI